MKKLLFNIMLCLMIVAAPVVLLSACGKSGTGKQDRGSGGGGGGNTPSVTYYTVTLNDAHGQASFWTSQSSVWRKSAEGKYVRKVVAGSEITIPSPTSNGSYSFDSWTDGQTDTEYDRVVVNKNISLTAKWDEVKAVVRLHDAGNHADFWLEHLDWEEYDTGVYCKEVLWGSVVELPVSINASWENANHTKYSSIEVKQDVVDLSMVWVENVYYVTLSDDRSDASFWTNLGWSSMEFGVYRKGFDEGSVVELPTPEAFGVTFNAWMRGETPYSEIIVTEDVSFAADWSINMWTVSLIDNKSNVAFWINAGWTYVSTGRYEKVFDEWTEVVIPVPTASGVTFAGWEKDGVPYSDTHVSSNVELEATWTINMWTVTLFDGRGDASFYDGWTAVLIDESYTKTVAEGTEIELPVPEAAGATFGGWKRGGQTYESVVVAGNVSFIADWSDNIWLVTLLDDRSDEQFWIDAGWIVTATGVYEKEFDEGTDVTLPVPTAAGATFEGWILDNETYSSIVVTEDVVFVASWQENVWTLTLVDGRSNAEDWTNAGWIVVSAGVYEKQFADGAEFTLPVPTAAGATFVGWFANEVEYSVVTMTGDVTLSAVWDSGEYAVYLHAGNIGSAFPELAPETGWTLVDENIYVANSTDGQIILPEFSGSSSARWAVLVDGEWQTIEGGETADVVGETHFVGAFVDESELDFGGNSNITLSFGEEDDDKFNGLEDFVRSGDDYVATIALGDRVYLPFYVGIYKAYFVDQNGNAYANGSSILVLDNDITLTAVVEKSVEFVAWGDEEHQKDGIVYLFDAYSGKWLVTGFVNFESDTAVVANWIDDGKGHSGPVTKIASRIFDDHSEYDENIKTFVIAANVVEIAPLAFAYSSVREIVFAEDAKITTFGDQAFWSAESIRRFVVPASVRYISASAFDDKATDLEAIEVAEGNTNFAAYDGILYNKAKTEILFVPRGLSGTVRIPETITSFGDDEKNGIGYGVLNLVFEGALEHLGNSWFPKESKMLTVTFNNTNPVAIASGLLRSGHGPDHDMIMFVPEGTEAQYEPLADAFAAIDDDDARVVVLAIGTDLSPTNTEIEGVSEEAGKYYFTDSNGIKYVLNEDEETYTLVDAKESRVADEETFADGWVEFRVDRTGPYGLYSVVAIGEDAFRGIETNFGIRFGDSVTAIFAHAFDGCENMRFRSTSDPLNYVNAINEYAFAGCENLFINSDGSTRFAARDESSAVDVGGDLYSFAIGSHAFDGVVFGGGINFYSYGDYDFAIDEYAFANITFVGNKAKIEFIADNRVSFLIAPYAFEGVRVDKVVVGNDDHLVSTTNFEVAPNVFDGAKISNFVIGTENVFDGLEESGLNQDAKIWAPYYLIDVWADKMPGFEIGDYELLWVLDGNADREFFEDEYGVVYRFVKIGEYEGGGNRYGYVVWDTSNMHGEADYEFNSDNWSTARYDSRDGWIDRSIEEYHHLKEENEALRFYYAGHDGDEAFRASRYMGDIDAEAFELNYIEFDISVENGIPKVRLEDTDTGIYMTCDLSVVWDNTHYVTNFGVGWKHVKVALDDTLAGLWTVNFGGADYTMAQTIAAIAGGQVEISGAQVTDIKQAIAVCDTLEFIERTACWDIYLRNIELTGSGEPRVIEYVSYDEIDSSWNVPTKIDGAYSVYGFANPLYVKWALSMFDGENWIRGFMSADNNEGECGFSYDAGVFVLEYNSTDGFLVRTATKFGDLNEIGVKRTNLVIYVADDSNWNNIVIELADVLGSGNYMLFDLANVAADSEYVEDLGNGWLEITIGLGDSEWQVVINDTTYSMEEVIEAIDNSEIPGVSDLVDVLATLDTFAFLTDARGTEFRFGDVKFVNNDDEIVVGQVDKLFGNTELEEINIGKNSANYINTFLAASVENTNGNRICYVVPQAIADKYEDFGYEFEAAATDYVVWLNIGASGMTGQMQMNMWFPGIGMMGFSVDAMAAMMNSDYFIYKNASSDAEGFYLPSANRPNYSLDYWNVYVDNGSGSFEYYDTISDGGYFDSSLFAGTVRLEASWTYVPPQDGRLYVMISYNDNMAYFSSMFTMMYGFTYSSTMVYDSYYGTNIYGECYYKSGSTIYLPTSNRSGYSLEWQIYLYYSPMPGMMPVSWMPMGGVISNGGSINLSSYNGASVMLRPVWTEQGDSGSEHLLLIDGVDYWEDGNYFDYGFNNAGFSYSGNTKGGDSYYVYDADSGYDIYGEYWYTTTSGLTLPSSNRSGYSLTWDVYYLEWDGGKKGDPYWWNDAKTTIDDGGKIKVSNWNGAVKLVANWTEESGGDSHLLLIDGVDYYDNGNYFDYGFNNDFSWNGSTGKGGDTYYVYDEDSGEYIYGEFWYTTTSGCWIPSSNRSGYSLSWNVYQWTYDGKGGYWDWSSYGSYDDGDYIDMSNFSGAVKLVANWTEQEQHLLLIDIGYWDDGNYFGYNFSDNGFDWNGSTGKGGDTKDGGYSVYDEESGQYIDGTYWYKTTSGCWIPSSNRSGYTLNWDSYCWKYDGKGGCWYWASYGSYDDGAYIDVSNFDGAVKLVPDWTEQEQHLLLIDEVDYYDDGNYFDYGFSNNGFSWNGNTKADYSVYDEESGQYIYGDYWYITTSGLSIPHSYRSGYTLSWDVYCWSYIDGGSKAPVGEWYWSYYSTLSDGGYIDMSNFDGAVKLEAQWTEQTTHLLLIDEVDYYDDRSYFDHGFSNNGFSWNGNTKADYSVYDEESGQYIYGDYWYITTSGLTLPLSCRSDYSLTWDVYVWAYKVKSGSWEWNYWRQIYDGDYIDMSDYDGAVRLVANWSEEYSSSHLLLVENVSYEDNYDYFGGGKSGFPAYGFSWNGNTKADDYYVYDSETGHSFYDTYWYQITSGTSLPSSSRNGYSLTWDVYAYYYGSGGKDGAKPGGNWDWWYVANISDGSYVDVASYAQNGPVKLVPQWQEQEEESGHFVYVMITDLEDQEDFDGWFANNDWSYCGNSFTKESPNVYDEETGVWVYGNFFYKRVSEFDLPTSTSGRLEDWTLYSTGGDTWSSYTMIFDGGYVDTGDYFPPIKLEPNWKSGQRLYVNVDFYSGDSDFESSLFDTALAWHESVHGSLYDEYYDTYLSWIWFGTVWSFEMPEARRAGYVLDYWKVYDYDGSDWYDTGYRVDDGGRVNVGDYGHPVMLVPQWRELTNGSYNVYLAGDFEDGWIEFGDFRKNYKYRNWIWDPYYNDAVVTGGAWFRNVTEGFYAPSGTRNGYVLTWFVEEWHGSYWDKPSGPSSVQGGVYVDLSDYNSSIMLIAHWEPIKISFYPNGNSFDAMIGTWDDVNGCWYLTYSDIYDSSYSFWEVRGEYQVYDYDLCDNVWAIKLSDGYGTFLGWFDQASGGNIVTYINLNRLWNDVILYAQTAESAYRVMLHGTRDSSDVYYYNEDELYSYMASPLQEGFNKYVYDDLEGYITGYYRNITSDMTVTLPTQVARSGGYVFAGWYDNNEFTGDRYFEVDGSELDGNLELYAKWVLPRFYVATNLYEDEFGSAAADYTEYSYSSEGVNLFDEVLNEDVFGDGFNYSRCFYREQNNSAPWGGKSGFSLRWKVYYFSTENGDWYFSDNYISRGGYIDVGDWGNQPIMLVADWELETYSLSVVNMFDGTFTLYEIDEDLEEWSEMFTVSPRMYDPAVTYQVEAGKRYGVGYSMTGGWDSFTFTGTACGTSVNGSNCYVGNEYSDIPVCNDEIDITVGEWYFESDCSFSIIAPPH